MLTAARVLAIAGGAIFLLLGLLHGQLALRDLRQPRAFAPPDAALLQAMRQSSLRLDGSINLWDAWMGFNLTHSLGLVLFGGACVAIGLLAPRLFAQSPALLACAVAVALLYLLVSAKFFFAKPVIGCALGLACFAGAALLSRL